VLHLIRSPQLVAETIRAVRAETPDTPEAAIIAVIDQFWPLWGGVVPGRAGVGHPAPGGAGGLGRGRDQHRDADEGAGEPRAASEERQTASLNAAGASSNVMSL
jgi:hypothetical protein